MSGPHATISAWTRNGHEGRYTAELFDYQLTVSWTAERPAERGGFRWRAEREGEPVTKGDEPFEEIESAMAAAERFARHQAEQTTEAVAGKAEGGG